MSRTVKSPSVRHEEILAAARQLFASQGIRATTVQDLARHVGVTRGLIYHYVGDVDSLVTQVLDSYIDQFTSDVRAWDAQRTPGAIDAAVMECVALFRSYVRAPGDDGSAVKAPLPRIDDASLHVRFMDSAVDALVDVLEVTTIPAYAAKHPIEITHVRETFVTLIHGLIGLLRSHPETSDDVLAALIRQTLRLASEDSGPHSAGHLTTLKGE